MACAANASGQTPDVRRGDRVRISISNIESTEKWRTGRLTSLDTSFVSIVENRNGSPLTVQLDDLDGFQRSLGRDTGRGIRWVATGWAFGFVVGAGLTLTSHDETPSKASRSWVTAGFGFAAIGAVAAGILGFEEQWGDVSLDVSPTASANADPLLRANLRF